MALHNANETPVSTVWVVNMNTYTHIYRTSLHVKYYALQHAFKGLLIVEHLMKPKFKNILIQFFTTILFFCSVQYATENNYTN